MVRKRSREKRKRSFWGAYVYKKITLRKYFLYCQVGLLDI